FSRKECQRWIDMQAANTPLAMYLNVDFEIVSADMTPDPYWADKYQRKEITLDELNHAARSFNNVVSELKFKLKVIK
ncbi:MAG: hypothetical protein ACM3IH_10210, partial [Sphingobacteriales bacterium]